MRPCFLPKFGKMTSSQMKKSKHLSLQSMGLDTAEREGSICVNATR